LLIRVSGTEPLVRIYADGETPNIISSLLDNAIETLKLREYV